ncbi:ParB N-terminal domain-containing protein [Methylosinus sp. Sm6]|uniref:ParB/RepB/Spo0J family partition protein n=1 Tax=Methylosinus sp. Sm6 TaxID=2866948 RepID=UPI001C99A825|nr:ParB N-terminal domain-containing protein [Methylosinus sp. Sm6]MBY6242524.1 ParB N-terminal domain-containing protein [Methylosinus sp. Sm6]
MTQTIRIDEIDDLDRLRPVDPDNAAWIATSIETKGLMQPIVVRRVGDGYKLIAGAHRLAALKLLGWETVTIGEHVLIREEISDATARISEIDENLARRDLNKLDRIIFIAERKKLYLAEHPETRNGGDRKSDKFKEKIRLQTLQSGPFDRSPRFTDEVAERVGLSKRIIDLACQLAEKLDSAALETLRGTSLEDNQNELIQLSETEPEEQRAIANLIKAGEAKSVVQAKIAAGLAKAPTVDPQARVLTALLENWDKATKQTRAAFLKSIGAEIAKKRAEALGD